LIDRGDVVQRGVAIFEVRLVVASFGGRFERLGGLKFQEAAL